MARTKRKLPKSTLEKWPNHVKAIGMITIELANLEILLGELLGALLHVARHFGRILYLTPNSTIARLKMLENVLHDTLEEESRGRKHIQEIIDKSKIVMGKRNTFIHNAWGVAPDNQKKILTRELPFKEKHPAKPVSLQEIKDLVRKMRILCDIVQRTTQTAYEAWPPYTWQDKSPAARQENNQPKSPKNERPLRRGKDAAPKR